MGQGPPGRWLGPHGTQAQLFGCCQNPGVCLMTYFCYPVTLGQLYSRAVEPMSCKKIAAILFVVHVFTQFVSSALTPEEAEENGDDGGSPLLVSVFGFMGIPTQTNTIMADLIYLVRNLIYLYFGIKARKSFRERDQIPEAICRGHPATEDCLCMWFCSLCNACMMMVHDLEVQQQEYSPHCCNCTEIGSGGVMQNQPQGAQGTPDPLVLRPLGQPQMGTVVQARAAPVQQPQVGVVVQGTVVKGP
mmetsp:Transcript_87107/g.247188  ORF Transcript_87107/g.247188 Transcript_87107/m.247188 type:complete len:246 (+) Transcript_87107:548-1285(+)